MGNVWVNLELKRGQIWQDWEFLTRSNHRRTRHNVIVRDEDGNVADTGEI